MNDKTAQQIYELSGYEPEVIKAQMQWSAMHLDDKEACKFAAQEWGRKPKALAYAWNRLVDRTRDYSRHELMSLILIAGAPKFERGELYEQWRERSMSYEDVRAALKRPKREKKARIPCQCDCPACYGCDHK